MRLINNITLLTSFVLLFTGNAYALVTFECSTFIVSKSKGCEASSTTCYTDGLVAMQGEDGEEYVVSTWYTGCTVNSDFYSPSEMSELDCQDACDDEETTDVPDSGLNLLIVQ